MIAELLAIDLGDSKTGFARLNTNVNIPEPLPTLTTQGEDLLRESAEVAKQQGSELILVGLPTSLHTGKDSPQTQKARDFAAELAHYTDLPIKFVDESLTTVDSQKWRERFPEAAEDSLAACVILERYMETEKN